jgi:FkbM family methyltransferase
MVFPNVLKSIGATWEVRARTFWGGTIDVILPEAVSTHIWRYGFFEEDVCLFVLNSLKKGMTFIDVGGHFGYFSLLGSCLVGESGKVLSFEPIPATYGQLMKNVARNAPYPNIEAIRSAAYHLNTTLNFIDHGVEYSAYNSAVATREGGPAGPASPEGKAVLVDARKIDDVLAERNPGSVDLVKIDAEWSELFVLQGLVRTIEKYLPGIILEVGDVTGSDASTSRDIITWLGNHGYDAYEAKGDTIVPHESRDRYEYGNLFFAVKGRLHPS